MQKLLPFFRDTEVANRYRVSRPTIWRWVKKSKFPKPIKLAGGSTRWRAADLEAWEHTQGSEEALQGAIR